MLAGHFEKGKWIEKPYYYPICVMKSREITENGRIVVDVPSEKGDTHMIERGSNYLHVIHDGVGWVMDKEYYRKKGWL